MIVFLHVGLENMFVDGNVKRGNIADVGGFFGNNRNFFDEVQNLCVVKLVKSADARQPW